jgi:hypothetical protein
MTRKAIQAMRSAANRAMSWSVGSRHLAEALERRVLLSDSSAVELFGTSPAVFVQNQGQWSDQFATFGEIGPFGLSEPVVGLAFAAVPEPSSLVALILGSIGLWTRSRGRR